MKENVARTDDPEQLHTLGKDLFPARAGSSFAANWSRSLSFPRSTITTALASFSSIDMTIAGIWKIRVACVREIVLRNRSFSKNLFPLSKAQKMSASSLIASALKRPEIGYRSNAFSEARLIITTSCEKKNPGNRFVTIRHTPFLCNFTIARANGRSAK